jgi:dethiobiotin synthetase
VADLAGAVRLPVVVVTNAEMGTINSTLLTVHAVRDRNLAVAGMVINCVPPEGKRDLAVESNLRELPRITGVPVRGMLPRIVGGMGARVSEVLVDRMMPFARAWWEMVGGR